MEVAGNARGLSARYAERTRRAAFITGGFLGFLVCALAILLQPAPTPALAQGTEPCNVYLDPGTHVFEVPNGVTEIEATVFGAQGGDVLGGSSEFGDGGLGGGATDVTIPVTAGELLEIVVGGRGFDSLGPSSPDPVGGFNGGGDGARGSAHTSTSGGGASEINRGATTLIIVGGGGGAAHGGDGGDGGLVGTDGTRLPGSTPGSTGGQAGGAGGAGGEGGDAGPGTADDQDGGDGAPGEGGDGGGHPTDLPVDGGGGGGGGFVGGGGGGGGPGNGGGGGGGGSSFDSTGTATFQTGVQTGDGLVTLTYDCDAVPEPPEACVTFDEAGTDSFEVPPGVTEIQATVFGAQGGTHPNATPNQVGTGGRGGGASGLPIPVTPGETLDIVVGGVGGNSPAVAGPGGPGGAPGGGGAGGATTISTRPGAGGGGASEIRRGTDTLVIGGGGGGGARQADGGAGGFVGTNGETVLAAVPGGFAGGYGGLGGGTGTAAGGNGSPGQGGTGGSSTNTGGGGGGGGAVGGGGGSGTGGTPGGGGGGGSSAHSLGQVPVTWQTGVEEGDGRVELAFDCADLGITKDATLVDEDTIEYTVTVENLGPNDATGVVATDPLPEQVTYDSDDCGGSADASGWTWTIGDLASGASVTCVITLTADEFGQIDNTASVDGDQVDLNPDNDTDPASVFVPSADLQLEKTAEPAIVDPSGQVTWTLTVTNNGPDPSTGSTVTDTLPPEVTNVAAQTAGCTVQGNAVSCAVGPLAVDGSTDIVLTGDAPSTPSTCFENAGSVTGDEADPDPDNNADAARACTPPVADLELVKSGPATVDPGGQVTWTLTVTNNGPNASSGSTVTDTLPASIINVQSSDCEVDGQTVTCDVGPLDVDGSASFEVTGTAPSTSATCFDNEGSVAGVEDDPVPDNNADSVETCTPPAADLELAKSAPATVDPGGEVAWTLTVTNHGPDASTGSTVTDTLPASITNVQSSDCEVDAQTVTCDVGPLAVDGSASFTVTGTAPSTSGTCFDNEGSVAGTEADPVPDNNADSVETCTPPVADLSLAKTADAVVEPGGQVTWTLTVTNEGPNPSTGSTVTDTLPPEVTNVAAQTAGCTVQDNVVSCDVGPLAVDGSTDIVLTGDAPSTPSTCFENAGSVEGTEDDPLLDNNDATVETCTSPPEPPPPGGKPKLKVNKEVSDDEARPGEVLSYRIVVRNKGKADARRVRVCDKLPNGQTLLSAPGADTSSDKRVCWKLKRLKAGAKRKFKVVTQIKLNTKAGGQKNKALVNAANGRGSRDAAEVDVEPVGGPCPSIGAGNRRC